MAQLLRALCDETRAKIRGTIPLQVAQQLIEDRQVLLSQRHLGAESVAAAEGMRIGDVDREKRNAGSAEGSRQFDERRKLPVVAALQSHAQAGRDAMPCRRP